MVDPENVVALLSTAEPEGGRSSVASRIEKRVQLLRKWKKEGVPQDRLNALPASLREAAQWDDQQHEIQPIRSPNDFTTTHPDWGRSVSEIKELLDALNSRRQLPKRKKSAGTAAASTRKEVQELKILLSRVTSQWHMARSAATAARDELEYEKALSADLKDEAGRLQAQLDQKDSELAALRRRLREADGKPHLAGA